MIPGRETGFTMRPLRKEGMRLAAQDVTTVAEIICKHLRPMNGMMTALIGSMLALIPGLPEIPTVPEPPPVDVGPIPVPFQARAEAYEADFLARINSLRATKGLPALALHSNLVAKADDWARVMAAEIRIWHSRVPDNIVADWKKLGENVGTGGSVGAIHDAFVDSPAHYRNLMDGDFTYIGVGVALSGATVFVAEVFMQLRAGTPPTPPSQPAPPPSPPGPKPVPPPSPPTSRRPTPLPTRPPAERSATPVPTVRPADHPARTPSLLLRSVLERLQQFDP